MFQVSGDPQSPPVELALIAVASWGPESPGGDGRRFTLLFHGPPTPVLPQRMYHFDHGSVGSFDIFIVPIGPEAGSMQYEAVFG